MKKCWVAVDKDGTEKISNSCLIRRFRIQSILFSEIKVLYSKNASRKWANGWSTDRLDPLPFSAVELPRGSIEKLIGRKLTWKDEPVEIVPVDLKHKN